MVIFSVLLFVLLGSGVIILLVPIIQTAPNDTGLNMGTRGVGFTGAVGSIGLVLSSLLYALVGRRLPLRGVLLGGFLLLGLLGLVIAVSRSMLLILLLAFAAGLLLAPIYITQDTILHQNIPAQVRGRVFSAREWLLNLAAALSAAVIGQLLLVFPPHFVVTYRLPLVGSELLLDARRILLLVISALVAGLSGYQLLATRRRPPATDAQLPAQEK
jgi:MFS family permease